MIFVWNEKGLTNTVWGFLGSLLVINYDLDFYLLFILDLYLGLWENDFYEMLDCEMLDID